MLLIGDLHGDFRALNRILEALPAGYAGPVIQLGDFSYHRDPVASPGWVQPCREVWFIDGNHDFFPDLRGIHVPTEVWPNCVFMPRGTVLETAAGRVGFLGGAESIIDREWRRRGIDWWPDQERVRPEDVERLVRRSGGRLDVLLTHTPPASVIQQHCSHAFRDPSSELVEQAWQRTGGRVVSGHLHRSIHHPPNHHILDVGELYVLGPRDNPREFVS
jgi:hypothetical protein